jgi:hypothetical protein
MARTLDGRRDVRQSVPRSQRYRPVTGLTRRKTETATKTTPSKRGSWSCSKPLVLYMRAALGVARQRSTCPNPPVEIRSKASVIEERSANRHMRRRLIALIALLAHFYLASTLGLSSLSSLSSHIFAQEQTRRRRMRENRKLP